MTQQEILQPGDLVTIAGSIDGVISRVIWARGMTYPFYLVEWWNDGVLQGREIEAPDVVLREARRESQVDTPPAPETPAVKAGKWHVAIPGYNRGLSFAARADADAVHTALLDAYDAGFQSGLRCFEGALSDG